MATPNKISADRSSDPIAGDGDKLSLGLAREIAHRSLERTRAASSDPADNGRTLPLPVPGVEDVTIGQALEAAFLQLELLKQKASGARDSDPLDWSEELLLPEEHLAVQALYRR